MIDKDENLNLRVSVCDDTVKTDLVEVGCLKLQHLVNTGPVDLVAGLANLLGGIIRSAETGFDDLGGVLVKQVKGAEVSARGDLDEFCKSVTDLSLGKCAEEGEVEESVDRSVVSA